MDSADLNTSFADLLDATLVLSKYPPSQMVAMDFPQNTFTRQIGRWTVELGEGDSLEGVQAILEQLDSEDHDFWIQCQAWSSDSDRCTFLLIHGHGQVIAIMTGVPQDMEGP